MFGNKILLLNFVKISKNKVKHKATASLPLFNTKSRNLSHQKITDCALLKNNGFANRISLSQNSWEIMKIQKCLSYISDDKCWNCMQNLERKGFTCTSCGALRYPKENINFFELLGITQVYDLDLDDLSKKFKKLQMTFHPDKFVNKPPEELEISESYSRLINKAYTTLKDPLSRGLYMLQLQKINIDTNSDVEPDFLMHIMDKNEEFECLSGAQAVTKFMEKNNEEMDKLILMITEAFRHGNPDQARNNLVKLNYFMNLDKKIKEKQLKMV